MKDVNKTGKGLAALFLTITVGIYVLLAGCMTTIGTKVYSRVTDKISSAVEHYCQQSEEERVAYRVKMDKAIAPNKIRIECAEKSI